MKKISKKELCQKIVLLDNYQVFVANDFSMKAAKNDEDSNLDLMIANGEFEKMVKKHTIEQLKTKLHHRIETFFSIWYKERIPEIQPIADRFDDNETNLNTILDNLAKMRDKDISDILNSMDIWPNPTMSVKCDKCTIKIYPSDKNYHTVEVSFYKWSQDPANDDWQFNIRIGETTLTINPDGDQERYAIYGSECMELAVYLYHHPKYLKKMISRIVAFRNERDKATNDYGAIKKLCYIDALDVLYKKAFDLYANKNGEYNAPFKPEIWADDNFGKVLAECCCGCGEEVEVEHSILKQGFKYKCPKCGETDHFCSLCSWADDNPNHYCDWNKETGECWRDRQWNEYQKTKQD